VKKERKDVAYATMVADDYDRCAAWPQVIPRNLIMRWCKEYVNATCLKQPEVCVCCGRV